MGTIELDALEVRLGGRAILNGLSGSLRGQAIGLLGPNGAGKSTLINTLLGFHRATSGTARVFGLDTYRDRAQIRGGIGYMPENDSFIGNMSGVRFVRYMAELAGLPSAEALERAHEALFYVGLGEVRYRKVNTYSLGMKQLIKLAQALAHGPRLLILDEPTNGLDPIARQRMIQLIQQIRKEGSVRLLISSHLLRDIDETCDEVLILKSGRIAALCNIEEERRSNRSFMELETVGATESFSVSIRGLGCEVACFPGGRIKLVLPEHVEARDLYLIASEQKVQIRRMHVRRDSLEDIFLRAMDYGPMDNGVMVTEGGRPAHVHP
ncbi:ABC-2 type transport system ATP-binding protein [Granulicella aggregans]|uniref:ABC-2 type transport system ATP-binding protein n=1 Tax=Granulicella aggregans TaxID=474949 RepID=A0A7W7ZBQ1_9BACT|nr:ABC transporter ATP-binding protein [Granulicella aggregans]MBB5056832.1 ABC-2 type transport system ATP-binding protein [Granulicella aggregans]